MEALSGVASGFAVASLSIQLVESVGKIVTFIRNVKNAPSEFIRLVELLERLHALLKDVRDVLEKQSSLQGKHFPMPSMTITKCLEGCEKSLKPLQDIIRRYERFQAQRDSIQAPAILNSRTETSIATKTPVYNDRFTLDSKSVCYDETQQTGVSTVRYFQRMSWMPSRFERFGVRQQKLVKGVYLNEERTGKRETRRNERCVEEDLYFWASQLVGYGISWSKRYPYGQILPSLTVYPVVRNFHTDLPFDIEKVSILEFQKVFTSNIFHPFTRDRSGRSLLHLAAMYGRGDIYRLVNGYGVRPDLSFYNHSPLRLAMFYSSNTRVGNVIDLLRTLFHEFDLKDDFGGPIWTMPGLLFDMCKQEEAEWMWTQSSNIFHGEDLLNFQGLLFRNAMSLCSYEPALEHEWKALSRWTITSESRHRIESGDVRLLTTLFSRFHDAFESFTYGSTFVTLLRQLDIDFKLCILNELDRLPSRVIRNSYLFDRKISFKYNEEKGWILGWDFEFDSESPIFHVMSEFSTMVTIWDEWPLHETDWGDENDVARYHRTDGKWVSRTKRQTANKARKERARTGQKRPRSKMPGAWA